MKRGILTLSAVMTATACTQHTDPQPQTIETETQYVSAAGSGYLNVHCKSSTTGRCRLLIHTGGARRSFTIDAGQSVGIRDVDQAARTCALPAGVDEKSCTWARVSA